MNLSEIKIYLIKNTWRGGTFNFFQDAIEELGIKNKIYQLPGWLFFKNKFIPLQLLNIEFSKKRLMKY